MSKESFIQQTKPVYLEGFIVLFLGILIIWNITATDISFHGNYVGFLIKECHPQNHDELCDGFREHLNVPSDAQMQLGDAYWDELARQALFIGFTMFALRISLAFLLHFAHVQRIRYSSWAMAVLYGIIGYGLFMFGVLDTLYFILQFQAVPDQLDWLNNIGVFKLTQSFSGSSVNVESLDLYITNFIGVVIIGLTLFVTMIFFRESNAKRAIA